VGCGYGEDWLSWATVRNKKIAYNNRLFTGKNNNNKYIKIIKKIF